MSYFIFPGSKAPNWEEKKTNKCAIYSPAGFAAGEKISLVHCFSVDPESDKRLKLFVHERGAEIWLLHANILLEGQVSVLTLPKLVPQSQKSDKNLHQYFINFF